MNEEEEIEEWLEYFRVLKESLTDDDLLTEIRPYFENTGAMAAYVDDYANDERPPPPPRYKGRHRA